MIATRSQSRSAQLQDRLRELTATLAAAIFAYNHATWYVAEVLALAGEYAQDYH